MKIDTKKAIRLVALPEPLEQFKRKAEDLLVKLEEARKTSALPLLYSMNRFVALPDVDTIYETLSPIANPRIDVILFSRGGDPDQAYLIGSMLQNFSEHLTVMIPRFAKSAATLIACSADEVMMLPPSELGPIDPVIESPETKRYVPVLSLIELVEMLGKKGLSSEVMKEVLGRVPVTELGDYNRLTEHMKELAAKLLLRRMFKDQRDTAYSIAEKLSKNYKSHDASITLIDAKDLGLKLIDVPKNVTDTLWSLHKLWLNTVVEYENNFPEGAQMKALNFNVGKGIVFSTTCKKVKE